MNAIQNALEGPDVVSVDLLVVLGRQSLRQVLTSDDVSLSTLENLWRKLQQSACSPGVKDKHLSAACNALCVFLQCTRVSKVLKVKSFAFSRNVWNSAFAVVHKAFGDGKHKPALQVLDTLTDLIHGNPDEHGASSILQDAIEQLLSILLTGCPENRLKEACIILSCFLRRSHDIVPFSSYLDIVGTANRQVFQRRCIDHNIGLRDFDAHQEQSLSVLMLSLLFTIQVAEPRTAALKLCSYLCSASDQHDFSENVAATSRVIQIYTNANDESLGDVSTMLFPAVMVDQEQFELFLDHHYPHHTSFDRAISLYLAILQVGRDKSFVHEMQLPSILGKAFGCLTVLGGETPSPYLGFDVVLQSNHPNNRLQAYQLLTSSTSPIQPISNDIFLCILRNMTCLHDESDPYYRDEFIGISRRFFSRIEKSSRAVCKIHANAATKPESIRELLDQYGNFLETYLQFLIHQLSPQVSYSRHILALDTINQLIQLSLIQDLLSVVMKVLKEALWPLLNLVLDPFDDVRSTSVRVLETLDQICHGILLNAMTSTQILQKTAELSAQTNRGDQADALGRLYGLRKMSLLSKVSGSPFQETENMKADLLHDVINNLQDQLRMQASVDPSGKFPLHGTLLGLVYLLERHREIDTPSVELVYSICTSIWKMVRIELCVDSPERATEIEGSNQPVGPKDLLAFSWRALRDSSLVIQALLRRLMPEAKLSFYRRFGDMCLDQLINLRHRGAFSTVAQTFTLCCQCARSSTGKVSDAAELIGQWQSVAFDELDKQASKLTRRSAGLPAIFCGLLDPADKLHFNTVIRRLMDFVSRETEESITNKAGFQHLRLPQVHALNCLKDIMTNSRFRVVTETLVVEMLGLAATTIASEIWAVRNCGLMLLRACINRIAPDSSLEDSGAAEHHRSAEVDTPLILAIKLLSSASISAQTQHSTSSENLSETVFAALDILSRVPTQPWTAAMVNKHFELQFGNRLWAVREHAARLRALRVEHGCAIATVHQLLHCPQDQFTSNSLHTTLFCVRLILQDLWHQEDLVLGTCSADDVFDILQSFCEQTLSKEPFNISFSIYLDILNDAYGAKIMNSNSVFKLDKLSLGVTSVVESGGTSSANALLNRAMLLNISYRHIHLPYSPPGTGRYQNDNVPVASESTIDHLFGWHMEDANAVSYTLKSLRPVISTSPRAFQILFSIWRQNQNQEIQALSMCIIADTLQENPDLIPEPDIRSLCNKVRLDSSSFRSYFDAEISLTASLITLVSRDQDHEGYVKLWNRLLNAIQTSLLDEVELSSRSNAVLAISRLVRHQRYNTNQVPEAYRLRLCLMIYQILNDDDEDVRADAASIAQSVLDQHATTVSNTRLCAITARVQLRHHINERFGHLPELSAHALCRIIGAATLISVEAMDNLLISCRKYSVNIQIDAIIRRSNDLFAEEKQNLYIDNAAEVVLWSELVDLRKVSRMKPCAVLGLSHWTNEGLSNLVDLLEDNSNIASRASLGPLGPTYHEEILVLFLRVINIARLLLRMKNEHGDEAGVVDSERFEILKNACFTHHVHHLIADAIQAETS